VAKIDRVTPFAAIFVPDDLGAAVSDRAWVAALLAAERALADAGTQAGLIDGATAAAIAAACDADLYDAAALGAAGRAGGNPVIPLVAELRERVGGDHAAGVHRGATSQDILDTAAMLVARDALALVDRELAAAEAACAELAETHRATVMAARTLLQQAVPTTFGAKAAGWLVGLVEARRRLLDVRDALPAQLGGAAGTLAAFGGSGEEVLRLYAAALGLREPVVPWHTLRVPVAELGAALAIVAGATAKIAGDVVLLAQTEVGEVAEAEPGGSSTMPHKQNAVAAVIALACERHARANAGILIEGLVGEHERSAGAWHAEWHALTTALAATGGAAASVRRSLSGLHVDVDRMRANVDPGTLAEAERFGIAAARPDDYLGAAGAFVDRALALYRG
jgi:3-carboxy-cis,cis-muconate cycloisomerase